jgi:hypothetical protein
MKASVMAVVMASLSRPSSVLRAVAKCGSCTHGELSEAQGDLGSWPATHTKRSESQARSDGRSGEGGGTGGGGGGQVSSFMKTLKFCKRARGLASAIPWMPGHIYCSCSPVPTRG